MYRPKDYGTVAKISHISAMAAKAAVKTSNLTARRPEDAGANVGLKFKFIHKRQSNTGVSASFMLASGEMSDATPHQMPVS